MIDNSNIIWDLLGIDYRNKVAILVEETESLKRKVRFFAPKTGDDTDDRGAEEIPHGKEIFFHLFEALKDLEIRLERYSIEGVGTIWHGFQNSAMALANYRMAMDDLAEALGQLTVIEDRFIQQMEARPLYFPAPRIFRRRHEEFQMYVNDQLINRQQKLVRDALSLLFPEAANLKNVRYNVLSSTEFIPDSRIVSNFFFRKKEKPGKGTEQVILAKHPYWFYSLPIMLPEMAHEHVHLCLKQLEEIGNKKEKVLLETHFNDLISEISLLFNIQTMDSYYWQQPLRYTHVMVEETISDIVAVMIFGEAYLLPLFFQLACVYEAPDLVQRRVTWQLPQLPWWGRLQILLKIFYDDTKQGDPPVSPDNLADGIRSVIQEYLGDRMSVYTPDELRNGQDNLIFDQYLVDLMVSWMRPLVKDACKRNKQRLPLARLRWKITKDKPARLVLSTGDEARNFTGVCSGKNKRRKNHAGYSLWRHISAVQDTLPAFGPTLETFLNLALPFKDTKRHGREFRVEVKKKTAPPWNNPLDQSVPLEYFVWAGYMATAAGMEHKAKTIMGSYYQLLVRGFLSGLPTVLTEPTLERNVFFHTKKGRFITIPYNEAVHKARQLSFVKWRMESFGKNRESFIDYMKILSQSDPWDWDQKSGYRFWTLSPFSAMVSGNPGFSRRSAYSSTHSNSDGNTEPSGLVDELSSHMGIFSEEMVICPWMVFESCGKKPALSELAVWHLTVQIRIKTGRIYFCQARDSRAQNKDREREPLQDPVKSLIQFLADKNLWHSGDTVYSALSWSQIVFILGPRTLAQAFEFKNALQGREEIDRTQTTFGMLINDPEAPRQSLTIEPGMDFQTTLRLGNIQNEVYTALQKALYDTKRFDIVEEVPGIFDIRVSWKHVPVPADLMDIVDIGKQVDLNHGIPENSSARPSLISDIQTVVSRRYNTGE